MRPVPAGSPIAVLLHSIHERSPISNNGALGYYTSSYLPLHCSPQPHLSWLFPGGIPVGMSASPSQMAIPRPLHR